MKILSFLSFLSVLCFVASYREMDGGEDIPSEVIGEEEHDKEESHCYDNCGEEGGFDYYQVSGQKL